MVTVLEKDGESIPASKYVEYLLNSSGNGSLPELSPDLVSEVLDKSSSAEQTSELCQPNSLPEHSLERSDLPSAVAGFSKSTLPSFPLAEIPAQLGDVGPSEQQDEKVEVQPITVDSAVPVSPTAVDKLSDACSSAKQASDLAPADCGQIEQERCNHYDAPSEAHLGAAGDASINCNVAPAPSMPSPGPGSTESTHETQTVGSLEEPQAKAIVVTEELKVAAKLMQDIHIQLFGQSKKRYKYLHRFIIVLLLMANKKLQPKNALLARLVKFCDANKADCDPPDPNSIVRQIVHFCFLPDGTGDVGILWALFKGCKDRSKGCYSFTRITDAIKSQQNSKAEHFLPVETAGRGNGKLKLLYRFGRDALEDLAAAVKVLGADGRDVGYDGHTELVCLSAVCHRPVQRLAE